MAEDDTPKVGTQAVDEFMGQQAIKPKMAKQSVYSIEKQQAGSTDTGELIKEAKGQISTTSPKATITKAVVTDADKIGALDPRRTAEDMKAKTVAGSVRDVDVAEGIVSDDAKVKAARGELTGKATAETGVATGIDADLARQVGAKEQITGATADTDFLQSDEYRAQQSGFVSDVTGATMQVTPDMTVEGQLARLSAQFTDGQVPSWAAGAVRTANQQMAARGLGMSSMAGAAVLQAAMEAAVPIAVQDSQTYYKTAVQIMNNDQQARLANTQNNLNVDLANTSNRQQMALAKLQVNASLAGQELSNQQQANVLNAEKFAEAANITFNFDQQREFANSKMMETMNLQNLSNKQATALANAAQMAQMDLANLNARQQAAVQNAQSFMQMDMANLSNTQQANVINQAAYQQAMLSDQAAENAAAQFNATSQNQVNQFFANLDQDINKFNAAAATASSQFNGGQANALAQFNQTMKNQREQFNATNKLAVEQSNVQWRRDVNTANTAAQNAANQINAANYLNISNTAQNNIWQQFRDEADYAYTASENANDRSFNMAMAILEADVNRENYQKYLDNETAQAIGDFITRIGISAINA